MTPLQSCRASLVPFSISPPKLKMRGVNEQCWVGLGASRAGSRRRWAPAIEFRCLLASIKARASGVASWVIGGGATVPLAAWEARETTDMSNSSLLIGPERLTMLILFLRLAPCVGGSRRAVMPCRVPRALPNTFLTDSCLQSVQGWHSGLTLSWDKSEGKLQCWQCLCCSGTIVLTCRAAESSELESLSELLKGMMSSHFLPRTEADSSSCACSGVERVSANASLY